MGAVRCGRFLYRIYISEKEEAVTEPVLKPCPLYDAIYAASLAMFKALGDDYKKLSWFNYETAFVKTRAGETK